MSQGSDGVIPKSWLTRLVTVEEAEAENSYNGLPFGYGNRKWIAFKSSARPGDEFWYFVSPPETWRNLAGRSGVALVREGTPVATHLSLEN